MLLVDDSVGISPSVHRSLCVSTSARTSLRRTCTWSRVKAMEGLPLAPFSPRAIY